MSEGFEVARLGGRMVGVRVFDFSGARALAAVEASLRDIGLEVGKPIFILCDLRELSDWSYTDIVSWARALRAANAYVAGGIYLAAPKNDALLRMLRMAADSTGHLGRRICTSAADVTERARDLEPAERAAATSFFFEQRRRRGPAKPIMKP
jgi:hypothetical protein